MRILLMLLFAFAASTGLAQFGSDRQPVAGIFYVSVDDAAEIYVNGKLTHRAGIDESRSGQVELKTGDRVVAHLDNISGDRRFMLVFQSVDGKTRVNFRSADFRIIPDLDIKDFEPRESEKWKKARHEIHKNLLPIKNSSQWVWGDLDHCIIGCVVTPEMFSSDSN